jgi:hypothetical protein
MKKHGFIVVVFLTTVFLFFFINFPVLKNHISIAFKDISFDNAYEHLSGIDGSYRGAIKYKTELIDINGLFKLLVNKKMPGNFDFIKDKNDDMQLIISARPSIENFKQNISFLSEKCKQKEIPLIYAYLPASVNKETLPLVEDLYFFNEYNEDIMNALREINGVYLLNTIDYFEGKKDVSFKTDLHFTTNTEFHVAELIANELINQGINFEENKFLLDLLHYNILSYDFIGNERPLGRFFTPWIDQFDVYIPKYKTDFVLYSPFGNTLKKGSYKDALLNGYTESPDISPYTYWVINYLQYPQPYYTIDNNLSNNETRLLFIMDSLSMRTITFAALGVKHITVIDPRQLHSEYVLNLLIANNGYDAVIVAGGSDFLSTARFFNMTEKIHTNQLKFGFSGMWVDYCNGTVLMDLYPLPVSSDAVSINLNGWAMDTDAVSKLNSIYVKVGNKFIPCNYGYEKQGVARTFNNPNLAYTGFDVSIPVEILNGVDEISFIQISADGTALYEPVNYKVNFY